MNSSDRNMRPSWETFSTDGLLMAQSWKHKSENRREKKEVLTPCLSLSEELQQCQLIARPVSRSRRGCHHEPSACLGETRSRRPSRAAQLVARSCRRLPSSPCGTALRASVCRQRALPPPFWAWAGSAARLAAMDAGERRGAARRGSGRASDAGQGESAGLPRWSPSRGSWRHRGSSLPGRLGSGDVGGTPRCICDRGAKSFTETRMVGWKGSCRSACSNSAALGTSCQSSLRGPPPSPPWCTSGRGAPQLWAARASPPCQKRISS